MKKILILGIVILIALFVSGCANNESDALSDEIKTISIDVDTSEDFHLSDFVEDVSYIPLEISKESVIGTIDKMYIYENEFYILDKRQDAIFIFTENGRYKRKLKRQGRGPGEYSEITDFSIDKKNGTILIADMITKSFYFYTSAGDFIKNMQAPNTIYFCELFDNKVIGYSDNFSYTEKFNLHIYDINNNETEDYLSINEKLKDFQTKTGGQFSLNQNNQMLFKEALSYKIYHIDSTGINVYYDIDFGKYNLPDNYFDNGLSLDEQLNKLNDGTFAVYPSLFFETADFILFKYQFQNFRYVLFNKKTKELIHGNISDDINHMFFVTPKHADQSAFYSVLEPLNITNYFSYLKANKNDETEKIMKNIRSQKENDVLLNIDIESNPVIVKYELK